MKSYFKKMIVLFLMVAILSVSSAYAGTAESGDSQQGSAMGMIGDFVLLRPLGLVATVTGFSFFCLASPFSALGGNIGDSWSVMVVKPAKFTFVRELGDAH